MGEDRKGPVFETRSHVSQDGLEPVEPRMTLTSALVLVSQCLMVPHWCPARY